MTAPTISFDHLVSDIETLARHHTGQARQQALAAFGNPRLDRFESRWLDKALHRVSVASSVEARVSAWEGLAPALRMVEARAGIGGRS
jgi:hypothetical protein